LSLHTLIEVIDQTSLGITRRSSHRATSARSRSCRSVPGGSSS
jgi:hypothetical protein